MPLPENNAAFGKETALIILDVQKAIDDPK